MVRNRTIVPAMYGGTCAVSETDVEEVVECNTQPCPVECVLSDWEEWAACTADCAGGTKTRERTVVTDAKHGADECGNTTETIPCNLFACPTPHPTPLPTPLPTAAPSPAPTARPTPSPTSAPTAQPTAQPTQEPTAQPTQEPTAQPTQEPTPEPTREGKKKKKK